MLKGSFHFLNLYLYILNWTCPDVTSHKFNVEVILFFHPTSPLCFNILKNVILESMLN